MRLNALIVVVAAAVLGAFAVLYFVIGGGSDDESENGLTTERQSPRVQQQQTERTTPNETTDRAQREQPNEAQEEASQEDEAAAQDGNEEEPVQPEAPQAESADPFTAELTEGIDEFLAFGKNLKERFQNIPYAETVSDHIAKSADALALYDAQLRRQNLPHSDRHAKLKTRLERAIQDLERPEIDHAEARNNPEMEQSLMEFARYASENLPSKLFATLDVQFDLSSW
ncbi:MAG: hypothetical protein OXT69_12745 [Candidatus Poribacteria bacterium]|nr:hypothetical protein [Candidatus Poribacteria bacterium]